MMKHFLALFLAMVVCCATFCSCGNELSTAESVGEIQKITEPNGNEPKETETVTEPTTEATTEPTTEVATEPTTEPTDEQPSEDDFIDENELPLA